VSEQKKDREGGKRKTGVLWWGGGFLFFCGVLMLGGLWLFATAYHLATRPALRGTRQLHGRARQLPDHRAAIRAATLSGLMFTHRPRVRAWARHLVV